MNSFDKARLCDLILRYGAQCLEKGYAMGSTNWTVEGILKFDEKSGKVYDEILEILYPTERGEE